MKEKTTERVGESRLAWEGLEAFARHGVQRLLQRVLEAEADELLGRQRYERREAVDPTPGYRNGFGKPRRLSMSRGTITVKRPRVRGVEERFESQLLPLFKRRTEEVGRLLPDLYLHGMAQGDFDLALGMRLLCGNLRIPARIYRGGERGQDSVPQGRQGIARKQPVVEAEP